MDIVEFLTAQLDEDAKLAGMLDLTRAGEPYSDGSGIADHDAFPHYPWGFRPDGEPEFMAGPGHPSRVLADVAAKRAMLTIHALMPSDISPWPQCRVCVEARLYDCLMEKWPCPTLRLLAAPYADHPDFDPAWRVEPATT